VANNTITLVLANTNATNGTFSGNGGGLTNVTAQSLVSGVIVTNGAFTNAAYFLDSHGDHMNNGYILDSDGDGMGFGQVQDMFGDFMSGGYIQDIAGDSLHNGVLKVAHIVSGVTATNLVLVGTATLNGIPLLTNAPAGFTNGIASYSSNTLALTSISFPATTVNWTNTFGKNINVFIDNAGVTGTALKINGTQIASSLLVTGDTMIPLQPGDYFSETYSVGTPSAVWKPF
jgi:hypothetical protein